VTGYWAILSGTAAYDDLHGTGTSNESFDACADTVEGTYQGDVHFD
jgi:hypothetical protein